MIQSIRLDNGTSFIDINESDDTDYPVHSWETEVAERLDERERAGTNGLWPVFPYENGMEITIEGSIRGTDADDYTTKRNALLSVVRYRPTTPQRKHGTIYVEFSGIGHNVWADYAIRSISAPRSGESPQYTIWRMVLLSFLPYFTDAISGDPYYDA